MEYVGKTVGQGIKPIETYWGHKGERGGGALGAQEFRRTERKETREVGRGGGAGPEIQK